MKRQRKKRANITPNYLKSGKITYTVAFMIQGKKYKKTFKTIAECRTYKREIENYVEANGKPYVEIKKTLAEVAQEWYSSNEIEWSLNTKHIYQTQIKKLKNSELWGKELRKISCSDIDRFLTAEAKQGKAFNTIQQLKVVLINIFELAVTNDYIARNEARRVKNKGKKPEKKSEYVTYESFQSICQELVRCRENKRFQRNAMVIALSLQYYLGLRANESLAVEKTDIDFQAHTIVINKQLTRKRDKKIEVVGLKSQSSNAVLPMPEPLETILKEWFSINPFLFVVCDENGDYIVYDKLKDVVSTASKRVGLEGFHLHALRHTFASNLVKSGADIKSVQALARHQDVSLTLNIYAEALDGVKREAINRAFSYDYPKFPPQVERFLN